MRREAVSDAAVRRTASGKGAARTATPVAVRSAVNMSRREVALVAVPRPLPAGDRADEQGVELVDPGVAQVRRHLGELSLQAAVEVPHAARGRVVGQDVGGERVPAGPGQEAPVPAGGGGDRVDEGGHQGCHDAGQVVSPAGVELRQEPMPVLVDGRHPCVEDRRDQPGAIAEVVLGGRVVALSGGQVDVAQGDRLDAPLGEESLGGLDDHQPGCTSGGHAANLSHLS